MSSSLLLRGLMAASTLVLALVAPGGASAQAYPNRPVTFVVPFPAGGGTDIAARLVATKLGARWGQTVVVDNRAGAAGIVGTDVVSKAKPDGYTLLIANVGIPAINPVLYAKLPYNPDTAFAPITQICELPFVLMATPSLPANNAQELVALAKSKPDKITFASSGSGGSPHLTGEIFQQATGVKLTHIPYKGGGPAMTDLMAGHVDLLFASILEGSAHIKSGKLKALAVTSAKRSPALPEVPTLAESGISGAESGSWVALLAPAGTPQAVIDKIGADVKEVLSVAETRNQLVTQGATAQTSTPAQLQALIDGDRARYGRVIREKGLKVE
jgi:tripartite-type tricarboxylate transporter receptor subunit TctC